MTIVEGARGVTGGVDTHLEIHVAAALDPVGALLGTAPFSTTPRGYQDLLVWLESFGPVAKVGIEGSGHVDLEVGVDSTRDAARAFYDGHRPSLLSLTGEGWHGRSGSE